MTLDELRNRYIELFGDEPTDGDTLEQIESQLGLKLPIDFRSIASFFSGGMVGGISHHAVANGGPATDVASETLRLRKSIGIPHSILVLAEPPESLIVLVTELNDQPAVIWLDNFDASRLNNLESLRNPQAWNSYSDFFQFLLDREMEERE